MNALFKANNILIILLLVIAISFTKSCGNVAFGQQADSLFLVTSNSEIIYNLKKPNEKHKLPYVLSEISGLTYTPNGTILTVDDETGKVFEYDLTKRKIVHSIGFANPGDYEGIELVNNKIYVLESDGDVYSFNYSSAKKVDSKKHENKLTSENDTEGLGFDAASNQLLIVCKEKGEVSNNKVKGRAVYGFDLAANKLSDEAFFTIQSRDIKTFWETHKSAVYEAKKIKFKPSAIAYHPIEHTFYVLASIGKLLLVINRDGSIKASYPIPPRILGQPEGICFAPNGDMYISSEGEGDRGYILKFAMIQK